MSGNFIGDDFHFEIVSRYQEYDKSRCFVIRKIIVIPKFLELDDSNVKDFEIFGPIEAVDVMPNKKGAYITFRDCYSAYLAVNNPANKRKIQYRK